MRKRTFLTIDKKIEEFILYIYHFKSDRILRVVALKGKSESVPHILAIVCGEGTDLHKSSRRMVI